MATPKQQTRSRDKECPSTPLSPSISSRKDERDQLANLNNRMAAYVEKVRSLETENSRLQIKVTSYEETSTREVTSLKAMYEREISEARRLLDELSKEKAQLQIESNSFREKWEIELNKASALGHDNAVLEGKLKDSNSLLFSRENQLQCAKREREEAVEEAETLRSKLNDIQVELEASQKALDTETLMRVNFENKLQSLKEELEFKEKLYQEEVSEIRKRHTLSVTEIDEKVKGVYESQFEVALIELRDQQNADLEQMKEDLEGQYSSKIEELKKKLDYVRKSTMKGSEDCKAAEMKVERLQTTIKSLQNKNNNLNNRVQDLEGQVATEREIRFSAVLSIEQQRDEALQKITTMEKEYLELMDLKIKLDHEIGVYRKLLEEEETRLNLSPSPHVDGSDSKRRSRRKRKRVTTQSELAQKAKKQEIASATYSSETVITQKSVNVGEDVLHQQDDPAPEGNNSCSIM
uniref:IF rod domain-containing protein n=1 Tax=Ciona intestinalis TaxID=7719 RepID=F6U1H7_CIOIN|nr:nuclear lamin [Ciona intestinalis]|eukprot:XP_002119169.1 lamin-L(II)-like isoform X1 [Ciona intestinalis]